MTDSEQAEQVNRIDAGKPRPARWQPLMDRAWKRIAVDPDTHCWDWTGHRQPRHANTTR